MGSLGNNAFSARRKVGAPGLGRALSALCRGAQPTSLFISHILWAFGPSSHGILLESIDWEVHGGGSSCWCFPSKEQEGRDRTLQCSQVCHSAKTLDLKPEREECCETGEHCLLGNKMKVTVFYCHLKESQAKSLGEGHSICTGAEALQRWLWYLP